VHTKLVNVRVLKSKSVPRDTANIRARIFLSWLTRHIGSYVGVTGCTHEPSKYPYGYAHPQL